VKLIRAEYDAYNRQFKLLDAADASGLRDGETYLFMDCSSEDLKESSPQTTLAASQTEQVDFALKQH